ncbi:hypothetical protein BKA80DRAFT_369 [Phyllosticta citrichinensis]
MAWDRGICWPAYGGIGAGLESRTTYTTVKNIRIKWSRHFLPACLLIYLLICSPSYLSSIPLVPPHSFPPLLPPHTIQPLSTLPVPSLTTHILYHPLPTTLGLLIPISPSPSLDSFPSPPSPPARISSFARMCAGGGGDGDGNSDDDEYLVLSRPRLILLAVCGASSRRLGRERIHILS